MFDALGYLFQGFIWIWVLIIASIPNIFMGGLTICVAATVLTYFMKDRNSF